MGQDRRESIFGFFGEWVWGCVKRWRPAALALESEQPEHRAAECAAIGKERGTIPRGNLVKERQRRAFRSGVGSAAFMCREREHQRAMKRCDIGTARAGMPGDETHAVFRVGIMRQRRNGAGAVDLVHQRGKERGRKIEQQPAVDHAHALHQRHSIECAKVERGDWPKEKLLAMMDATLTRADDRALFDLPAPATEPAFLDGNEPVEPPALITRP